jgi:formate dehydrogenase iron-sulfur subunit
VSIAVYVPRDSSALSVGADEVAQAIASTAAARRDDIRLVRNGSRGLFWLEPMVEVATPAGRIAYGPVSSADVFNLFVAGFLRGGAHFLLLGPTDEILYLKE